MKNYILIVLLMALLPYMADAQIVSYSKQGDLERKITFSTLMLQSSFPIPDLGSEFALNPNELEIAIYNKSTNKIEIYNLKTKSLRLAIDLKGSCSSNLVYSANNNYFAYSEDALVHVLDPITYIEKFKIAGPSDKVVALAISPDSKKLAVQYVNAEMSDSRIVVYNSHDDKKLAKFKEPYTKAKFMFSHDGRLLISSKIYDLLEEKVLNNLSYASAACLAPSEGSLVGFENNGDLKFRSILGLEEQKLVKTFHRRLVSDLSFSSDGRYMATCSYDSSINYVDLIRDTLLCSFKLPYAFISQVEFSRGGEYIVSLSLDKMVRLWHTEKEKIIYYHALAAASKSEFEYYILKYPEGKYTNNCREYIDTLDYEAAKNIHTMESYKTYLEQQPRGRFYSMVYIVIDDMAYDKVKGINTIKEYERYVKAYPNGQHKAEANAKIDELYYERAQKENFEDSYQDYISRFPAGRFKLDALENIEMLVYRKALKDSSIIGINKYLDRYPNGKYVEAVKQKIDEFKPAAEQEVFENAMSGDLKACLFYEELYPNGKYAKKVKIKIKYLQNIEREKFEAAHSDSLERVKETSGTFTDPRDGHVYKTIKIGQQWILAENLAYKLPVSGCKVYDNNPKNLVQYGYLYDWDTAQKACPPGWHLPSKEELELMFRQLSPDGKGLAAMLEEGGSSRFNGVLGGKCENGKFMEMEFDAYFWCSTPLDPDEAYTFGYSDGGVLILKFSKRSNAYSLRLFQDR